MPRRPNQALREFLLQKIPSYPREIAAIASKEFGITRQVVNRTLKSLTAEGLVVSSGRTSGRSYALAVIRDETTVPVDGAEEDRIWREWVLPRLQGLKDNVLDICHYAVTEMINNAIDHSEGTEISISLERTAASVQIMIADNGVGLFKKITDAFNLEDEQHAALELVKGKLTTDPDRHTGEGIFFTSRAVDEFIAASSNIYFAHSSQDADWLIELTGGPNGTVINLNLNSFSDRRLRDVFDKFTTDHNDYAFDVTHIPVSLAKVGEENLVSRSQAKRLTARFERFKRVFLDFGGVNRIGQAFADEVFRVYPLQHPDVEIIPMRADPDVMKMVTRAMAARNESGSNG